MGQLEGKVALVTGATSGIGATCAEVFAKNGAFVVIVGRNKERGKVLENKLCGEELHVSFLPCDITCEDDVNTLIENIIHKYGKLDIVMNNAGMFPPSVEIERLDYQAWKETFDVNLNGYFLVSKYTKPHLIKSKGVILNNASIAGMHSYAIGRAYAYSASKAAVIQFTRMMAKNYAEEGVRVNAISPGIIWTPMMHDRDPELYIERIPMKRVGTPDDVAKVALFLVSNESAYITGVNIPIDGGASL